MDRIPTQVHGLDDYISGGIPQGSVCLVAGRPGSMKSTLSFHVLYHAVRSGTRAVYITLEQSRASLEHHLASMGYDLSGLDDRLKIVDMAILRKGMGGGEPDRNWIDYIQKQIAHYRQVDEFGLVTLDSLSALYALSDLPNPRNALFLFFERLRELELTALLISEMDEDSNRYGLHGVEGFLADSIIHLHTREQDSHLMRFLRVVKMRATKHTQDFFPMVIDQGGFSIVDS